MKVQCKSCGNRSRGAVDRTRFEPRGYHRGSIFRCVNCGGGVRVSSVFERSKRISRSEWCWLEQTWAQNFGPVDSRSEVDDLITDLQAMLSEQIAS